MNQGVHGLEPRSRILTLMALVLSAYLVLLGRLVYWQVWRHGDMAQLAAAYHDDTITLPAVRGNILDRNGALLVTNTPVFSIFASPDLISAAERQVIADRLAPVLGLSPDDIQAKLATTRKFVYLARRVPASIAGELGQKLVVLGAEASLLLLQRRDLVARLRGGGRLRDQQQGGGDQRYRGHEWRDGRPAATPARARRGKRARRRGRIGPAGPQY